MASPPRKCGPGTSVIASNGFLAQASASPSRSTRCSHRDRGAALPGSSPARSNTSPLASNSSRCPSASPECECVPACGELTEKPSVRSFSATIDDASGRAAGANNTDKWPAGFAIVMISPDTHARIFHPIGRLLVRKLPGVESRSNELLRFGSFWSGSISKGGISIFGRGLAGMASTLPCAREVG